MSELVLGSSLKEFFRLLLENTVSRRQVTLAEVTEFYVVNLLSEFASAEKLFTQEGEGSTVPEALALLYHRALQQGKEERIKTLRRLGDVSLYTVGFFGSSLKDRVVGPDYYVNMGEQAYAQLASLSGHGSMSGVYWELHQKFKALVEVLEEIAARQMCASGSQGTLRVFESWNRSPNGHLEKVLVDVGLLPSGPVN